MNTRQPSTRRARTRRADPGFTLIELLFAIVLSAMISGAVAAGLITALNVFSSTKDQVTDSTDAGLISSFLVRDAQSAGGIDPATALPDPTLGVSSDPSDVDGKACMTSGLVTADVKVRFKWIDRTSATANTNVVVYALDTATHIITRHLCTNGAYVVQVVLGRNLTSATTACQYESSLLTQPTSCGGHPMSVSMTLVGTGTRAPLTYTLTASLRSAPSLMAIMLPTELKDGRLGVPYASDVMTTIGASAQTKWSQTGLPAGLTIDPWTGMIYGTPNPTGPFPVTSVVRVTVSDVLFATTATRSYTIVTHGPPVAVPDGSLNPNYATNEDTTLTVVAPGVLANDSRREGNPTPPALPTKATVASGVFHGKLVFNANGSFTYTPELNWNGTDSFTYRANETVTASDGSPVQLDSAPVLVTLTVNPVNDAPVNQVPVAQETAINTPEELSNPSNRISIRDVDAGGATVRVQLTTTNGTVTLPGATGLSTSTGTGTAAMSITGSIANINLSLARATFTPTAGFAGGGTLTIATNDLGNSPAVLLPDTVNTIPITIRSLGIFTDKKDIGDVTASGTASSYASPTYTVKGSGWDIFEANDGFQFIYRALTTDGSLTAKIVSETVTYVGASNQDPTCRAPGVPDQPCKSVAKAGVMFRQDLTSVSAINAMVGASQGNGSQFTYRTVAGDTTDYVSAADTHPFPYWVRLTRHGNQITAEISTNGTTWAPRGTTQIDGFGSSIYVGLAVSAVNQLSGDNPSKKLNTATFDNVSISTPPAGVTDSYAVSQNTTSTIPAISGVLANDSDPESNSLTARVISPTAGLTLNPDGSFTYAPPANFNGATFTYVANDGAFDSAAVTVNLTVNPIGRTNTAPSFTKGADQRIRSNLGTQSVPLWATAITPGAADAGQAVDFVVTNSNNALFSVQPSISADGTLTYAPAPAAVLTGEGAHGTATVSVIIHDNGGTTNGGIDTSAAQTFTITIVAPPVLTTTAASLSYTENGAATFVDSGITVTDADSTTLGSATVAVASGYVNGQDLLSFTNQNGITGIWTPATGVYALTGTSSIANYQAALRSITYSNASDNPSSLKRAVTFVANDGLVSGRTATRTIAVIAVNDPPINSVPVAQRTSKGVAEVFSIGNGNLISISDADAGGSSVQVQLVSTNGTTTLSGSAGLTFNTGDSSSADADMTFAGTISDINTALAGLRFAPTTNYVGTAASLRVITNDQGNTGSGGALIDDESIAITVWSPDCPATIVGWRGQYYGTDTPTGTPVLCRDDAQISFDWGNNAPDSALPSDHFSVRWTKTQSFAAGYYAFTMGSDDESKLYIDPANDPPSASATSTITASYNAPSTSSPIFLAAGNHTIVMEYHENTGGALANLTWVAVAPPSCSTPPSGSSTAWFGEYFNNTSLTGLQTECRNDASINFNWGGSAPFTGMLPDGFSVRWTKTQTFAAGTYSFILGGDDGIRLLVDGALVASLNSWSPGHSYPGSPNSVNVAMTAGSHTLVVEYYENTASAQATLDVINPLTFGAFTNSYWSGAGSPTVFYRSAAPSGSFTAIATSTSSAIASYGFPSLGTNWTSTPGALGINTYAWSGSPASPGTKNVTATNGTGLTSSPGSPFTLVADNTAPSAGAVDYPNGTITGTTVNVTFTTGTDTGSGVGLRLLQRAEATFSGGTCSTSYGAFATLVTNGTNPTSPVVDTVAAGKCYKYQYVVADNVGNQVTATSIKVAQTARKTYLATITGETSLVNYWRLGEATTAFDTFTGTSGDHLQSHAAEIGGTWIRSSFSSGDAVLTAANGRIRKDLNTSGALYYSPATPTSMNYLVEADVYVASLVNNDKIGIAGRFDPAAVTAYEAVYDRSANQWQLYKFVNGTGTVLSTYSQTLSAGSTYRLALDMTGSTIRLLVDGVQRISVVDGTITNPGQAAVALGFGAANTTLTNATGMQLDNFTITPPLADSGGTNIGDYLNGPKLRGVGAIASDSDTAATFDGLNDFGTVANSISGDFSIEFWFKSTTGGIGTSAQWWGGAGLVDADVSGSSGDFGISLRSDGKVVAGDGAPTDTSIVSTSSYKDGNWHHVVFTRTMSSGALQLYIDGASAGSATGGTAALTGPSFINFGRIQSGGNYFAGSLDEIAIYNTVLTQATVTAHFTAAS